MRLATIYAGEREQGVVVHRDRAIFIESLNAGAGWSFPDTLQDLVCQGQTAELQQAWAGLSEAERSTFAAQGVPVDACIWRPLYRRPRKIWGIGLNYREHAGDLQVLLPTDEPASFMKADTTVIGPGDAIRLPPESARVTAEAELGIVIGQTCHNISVDEVPLYVAGLTTILDMTAEDILQKNPRFLTRAKNFDTFFSFGPELVTLDEVEDVHALRVATVNNSQPVRTNQVANMTFLPWFLVAFHARVMTLLPGDIIATGTPGAVVIRDGDVVRCEIDGFRTLENLVRGPGAV